MQEVEVDGSPSSARGSPRSRRGSPSRDRRVATRRSVAPSRPSSRSALRAREARERGALVPLVRPRGVEDRDPCVDGGRDGLRRRPGEPHAAEADAELVRASQLASRLAGCAEKRLEHALPPPRPRAERPAGAARTARVGRGHARRASDPRRSRRRGTSRRTSPLRSMIALRCSCQDARCGRRGSSTRLSQRGRKRGGAGVSAGGSGARGRSTSSRPSSSRKRLSRSRSRPASTPRSGPGPSTADVRPARGPERGEVAAGRGGGGLVPGSGVCAEPGPSGHERAAGRVAAPDRGRRSVHETGVRGEPVPDEPRRSLLDAELRPTEQGEELGSRPRLLGREGREALAVGGEVGLLTERRELTLELAMRRSR